VPLIEGSIDETQRVTLRGNTRPEALRAEFDRGAVDDSFPLNGMQPQLKRSPEHEAAAEALADELHRKGSPQFRQWLSAADCAEQFGVHPQDIETIRVWLTTHGFTVHASAIFAPCPLLPENAQTWASNVVASADTRASRTPASAHP
jgi:hypothetical protein